MRANLRRPKADESGFTLVEMMVVMAILGIVLSAIFGVLVSLTKSQAQSQALADNQESVRLALGAIALDLRSATKLDALPLVTDYPNQVQFETRTSAVERWRYDTTAQILYREVYNSANSTWASNYILARVRNVLAGTAVFRYYRDASDTELDPAVATSTDIANCAIHVHVTISANPEAGPQAFTAESDADLRNRLTGGIPGC